MRVDCLADVHRICARLDGQRNHRQIRQAGSPHKFIALCQRDGVSPDVLLRGFIVDLCELMGWAADPCTEGYCSNGSDDRRMAMEYFERVGYPWWNKSWAKSPNPCMALTRRACSGLERNVVAMHLVAVHAHPTSAHSLFYMQTPLNDRQ